MVLQYSLRSEFSGGSLSTRLFKFLDNSPGLFKVADFDRQRVAINIGCEYSNLGVAKILLGSPNGQPVFFTNGQFNGAWDNYLIRYHDDPLLVQSEYWVDDSFRQFVIVTEVINYGIV